MIVKTKNYKLDKKTYISTAFKTILKKQGWMAALGAIVLCLGYFIPGADSIWWFIGAFIALGLYLLFWWIQFYGVTQLEQGKLLFEKFSYEITSQQILMKLNPREGMPLKWDQIKSASIGKEVCVRSAASPTASSTRRAATTDAHGAKTLQAILDRALE